jgi:hypothetical protein
VCRIRVCVCVSLCVCVFVCVFVWSVSTLYSHMCAQNHSELLVSKLEAAWAQTKHGKTPIASMYLRAFAREIVISMAMILFESGVQILQPICLGRMVRALTANDVEQMYLWAMGLAITSLWCACLRVGGVGVGVPTCVWVAWAWVCLLACGWRGRGCAYLRVGGVGVPACVWVAWAWVCLLVCGWCGRGCACLRVGGVGVGRWVSEC